MFDSMLDHKDLIFQDSTVRLVHVPDEDQTYDKYLGPAFMRGMERNENIDCVTGGWAVSWQPSCVLTLTLMLIVTLLLH